MKSTGIEWTDFSTNPLKYQDGTGRNVWACVKHSPGCQNCYAEELAFRYNRGRAFTLPNINDVRPFVDTTELKKIITAKTVNKIPVAGKRCFLGDMTDIFGEWVTDDMLDLIFATMALRNDLTFQILTKRPERMAEYLEGLSGNSRVRFSIAADKIDRPLLWSMQTWPLSNVWVGTSVENQKYADIRIAYLLQCPAVVRFLSCEPLLGPIHFGSYLMSSDGFGTHPINGHKNGPVHRDDGGVGVDWVIVGGESGPNARPMASDWAWDIQEQCAAAGTPFFFKQYSEWADVGHGNFGSAGGPVIFTHRDGRPYKAGTEPQKETDAGGDDIRTFARIGCDRAGRLLIGKEYNEFPTPRTK